MVSIGTPGTWPDSTSGVSAPDRDQSIVCGAEWLQGFELKLRKKIAGHGGKKGFSTQ